MSLIPAITVWQPWASLIVVGFKPWEFRKIGNPKSYCGKRIAIHAGARKVRPAEIAVMIMRLRQHLPITIDPRALPLLEEWHTSPGRLPLSAILGTAIMDRAVRVETVMAANDSDRDNHFNWAWPMSDPTPLEPICPAKGQQGWWHWDADKA